MALWRQLLAIGILPFTVTVLVPAWIAGPVSIGWGLHGPLLLIPPLVGTALVATGLTLMARTISLFHRVGKGTLAPWDETRNLVVEGSYRHVRNPMISGVFSILLGEAILLGSFPIFVWLLAFVAGSALYIPLSEEPRLERRFGEPYLLYKHHVPRWIPHRTPWDQLTPEG
ncbi:MAG: isoprenylcysteine carboxylmethyltransferase family protein [Proteobacteria bacterium]|nr:isoprenylcysteine carboxylmethyltransferase family protein [Pseudomonadota bacterium]